MSSTSCIQPNSACILPSVNSRIRVDESVLPANQIAPYPESFFLKFAVDRFIHVHHKESTIECKCFEPIEVGRKENSFYLPLYGSSYMRKIFTELLDDILPVHLAEKLADEFFSGISSKASNNYAFVFFGRSRKKIKRSIVPISVRIEINLKMPYHEGIESCIAEYVNKIRRSGSKVACSSMQVMKRIKLNRSSTENCSICFEDFDQKKALQLPCSHLYHPHCIERWFKSSPSCPLCRSHIE